MHVVRRFRYGIDGETEAVAGDSVCHIAPCQLRCDQSIAQQQIARCMMPSGETVGAVSGSAKFWSEWQDLNLRPPRPERGGPRGSSMFSGKFNNVRPRSFGVGFVISVGKLSGRAEGIDGGLLRPVDTRDRAAIERAIAGFAAAPNGGMIVTPSATVSGNREVIVALASQHKLPAVYPYRYMVTSGGLNAYGPDPIGQYGRAAGYVDRIFKGEKPADLPVQAPTKFDLVINLRTAKSLDLTMPPSLLAAANEVIE